MVAGHFGVSFAVMALDRRISLWVLFVAAQLVDLLWALFVLIGLEKVRIVPGITATHPIDLYYMPYTHSLLASLAWAAVAFFIYKLFASFSPSWFDKTAFWIALAVLSHWFLDLVVHRPDLPLYDDVYKLGLGLWDYPMPAFLVEAAVLFGGIWLYLQATLGTTFAAKYGMVIWGAAILLVQSTVFFVAPPRNGTEAAMMLLALYAVSTWIVFWLDKKRVAITVARS